jgi:hypothetical protein
MGNFEHKPQPENDQVPPTQGDVMESVLLSGLGFLLMAGGNAEINKFRMFLFSPGKGKLSQTGL